MRYSIFKSKEEFIKSDMVKPLVDSLGNFFSLLCQKQYSPLEDKKIDAYILMNVVGDLFTKPDLKTILKGYGINEDERKDISRDMIEEQIININQSITSSKYLFSFDPSTELATKFYDENPENEQRIISEIISGSPQLILFDNNFSTDDNTTNDVIIWLYYLYSMTKEKKEHLYPDLIKKLSKSPFECYDPRYGNGLSINSTIVLSILLIDVIRSDINLGEDCDELLTMINNREYNITPWSIRDENRSIQERQIRWLAYLTGMVSLSQLKKLPSQLDSLLFPESVEEKSHKTQAHRTKSSRLKNNLKKHLPSEGESNELSLSLKYHAVTIVKLQQIMGIESYAGLVNSMIVNDGTQLIRFLEQLDLPNAYIGHLKNFFTKLTTMTFPEVKRYLILFSNVIRLMPQIPESGAFSERLKSILAESHLEKVTLTLTKLLTEMFYKIINVYLSEDLSKTYQDLSMDESKIEQFIRLLPYIINGFNSLSDNKDKMEVYVKILMGYFSKNTEFRLSFTNPDLLRESNERNDLLKHNIDILKQLDESGINIENMMNYPTTIRFTIDDSGKTALDVNIAKKTINNSITETLEEIKKQKAILAKEKDKSSDPYRFICKIETALKDLQKLIKQNHEPTQIQKKLSRLHSQSIENISSHRELCEHFTHVMTFLNMYIDEQRKISTTRKQLFQEPTGKKIKTYEIRQVNKENPDYLILGDQLSCCLATNGTQFPALIERLTDSAMQVHAVYDTETNRPVCGTWLFLAMDKNTQEVYVVANFCEIAAGIGGHKQLLAKELIHRLMEFTAEFAKDIGAKKFIMRQLIYGMIQDDWVKEFCTDKSMNTYELEKIGGFYGSADYYLVGLRSGIQFHNASNVEHEIENTPSL